MIRLVATVALEKLIELGKGKDLLELDREPSVSIEVSGESLGVKSIVSTAIQEATNLPHLVMTPLDHIIELEEKAKGKGRGHWGHRGRKGKRGGSLPSKGSPGERASRHLKGIDRSKIPSYLSDYDKALSPRDAKVTLGQTISALDASDIPGEVSVIGGIARRGFGVHDVDMMVSAPSRSLDDISQSLREFRDRLPGDVGLDVYVHHKDGYSAGDPGLWVESTEIYFNRLANKHSPWTYKHSKLAQKSLGLDG